MNREILFRGKRVDNGEWMHGCYLKERTCDGIQHIIVDEDGEYYPINLKTRGQYTGLTDRNGVKIFEGDIIVCRQPIWGNFIDEHIERGYVEMKHGAFGLRRKQGYYRPFKDWLEDYEYEVIGNVHDGGIEI